MSMFAVDKRRSHAFTLIEVLVVVAIIAVFVGSMAIGIARGGDGANKSRAARALVQLGRYARTMALLKQRPAVLRISSDGGISVFMQAAGSSSGGNTPDPGALAMPVGLPEGMSFDDQYASFFSTEEAAGTDELDSYSDTLVEENREEKYSGIKISVELLSSESSTVDRSSRMASRIMRSGSPAKSSSDSAGDGGEEEDSSGGGEEIALSYDIVYETNGRCRPYRAEVFREGDDDKTPIVVSVDRFGGVKVEEED